MNQKKKNGMCVSGVFKKKTKKKSFTRVVQGLDEDAVILIARKKHASRKYASKKKGIRNSRFSN